MDKDRLIGFKSTTKGVSKNGNEVVVGERIQLSLDPENLQALIDELTAKASNPKGVKLDIHVRKKTNSQTGMEFDSAFGFVKSIQDAPGGFAGPKKYVAKTPAAASAASATAASVIKGATLKG